MQCAPTAPKTTLVMNGCKMDQVLEGIKAFIINHDTFHAALNNVTGLICNNQNSMSMNRVSELYLPIRKHFWVINIFHKYIYIYIYIYICLSKQCLYMESVYLLHQHIYGIVPFDVDGIVHVHQHIDGIDAS